jgi:predicted aspartyl protease
MLSINKVELPHHRKQDKWVVPVEVGGNGANVTFRIDTGARCNVMVQDTYRKVASEGSLRKSSKVLYSYSNHRIRPAGVASLCVKCNGVETTAEFEIVDLQQESVISGNLAEQLRLIHRINDVSSQAVTQLPPEFCDFPELMRVTGTLPGTYTIKIDPSVKGVVHPVRRQPAALRQKITEKLREMEVNNQIIRVEEPSEWVSSMVVALKKDKVRICIDPRDLNKAIKREHYPMKTVEEVVSTISGAKLFSVLDAKSGFLQIKLDYESSLLTTFNTPVGRYRWLRLPFGLKCAPEIFQRVMDQMLEGIDGATAIMDDILIAGRDKEHHDTILKRVLGRVASYNLQLNFDKCLISRSEVSYVGHLISADGLRPDPEKTKAISEMPEPQDKGDVKRFLGFVSYLRKFIPNLSDEDESLRSLLKSDTAFCWQPHHRASFQRLKDLCSSTPVLAYYDVQKPVQIQCDASSKGLGAVLQQDEKPVAYASRSLSDTETRYAQIEKEMLSIVFATTKFHQYIFGKSISVYNDHKPLEAIFKKPLLSAPMRLQRMLLKLQCYDISVNYQRGSDMQLADTLSRAYLPEQPGDGEEFEYVNMTNFIPISSTKYQEIQQLTANELNNLYHTILNGWPNHRREAPRAVQPYWDSRDQLSVSDGIIYKGMRVVIPPSLRRYMLALVHESHLGMAKCKQRAREVMYWPAMNADIENTVRDCARCSEYQNQLPAEPLEPTPTPDLPFMQVGLDLFEFESKHFIVLVDYYSKFIEVDQLRDTTTASVIHAIKAQFCRYGIPEKCRSDNGPQFQSHEFRQFCHDYGVQHTTSSPHYPQSNGEAERAVQTVKRMWKKATDRYKALLDYRSTPLEGVGLSPAQLLLGRRPRNMLPAARQLLAPNSYCHDQVRQTLQTEKNKQKHYYDRSSVRPLPPLVPGDPVRMSPLPGSDSWLPAKVVQRHRSPRSYVVECSENGRKYRRNRRQLRKSTDADITSSQLTGDTDLSETTEAGDTAAEANAEIPVSPANTPNPRPPYQTRCGRVVRPPARFDS